MVTAGVLMATSTLISIEDYLKTVYRPDVEYIDGELRPKNSALEENPVVMWAHVRLQSILCEWFGTHEDEWGIIGGPEARARVSSKRVRIPDIAMIPAGSSPETLVEPPLIVIEIVSPSDRYSEIDERMRDYAAMGVPNLWIIDPQQRVARERRGDAWVDVARLAVPGSPIYVDVPALFVRLDKYASK